MSLLLCLVGGCGGGGGSPTGNAPAVSQPAPQFALDEQPVADSSGSATSSAVTPGPKVFKGYGVESYRLVEQKDEIVSVLTNGAVVIVKRVPSPVLAVRAYAQTGGVYEGQWLGGGLSHLLEHLVAGGTTERRTEAQNRDLLQELGNNSNAYTTTDHTAYFVNTTPDRLDKAVDLVTGWVLGAKITPAEYAREYEVVQRELEMDKGEPDQVFAELTNSNRYHVNPARVPVIGYQEVIQGLSRDDVYNYYKLAYHPNNLVFSIAGDADPEVMLKSVQKYVDEAPPGRAFTHNLPAEPQVQAPRTSVATFPKLDQARLELGFPTIQLDSPDLYAVDLLAQILGGSESSILVEELRDKKELVTGVDVSSNTPTYADGTFSITMMLPPAKIAEATKAAMAEIDAIRKDPIDDKRIERAKVQMKAARVKHLQTSEDIASALATDYISTGDPHFSDRYVTQIQAVTAAQLQNVAKKYLLHKRLLTTALLPSEFVGADGLPKAADLLRPVAPTTKPATEHPASQVVRTELDNGTILLTKRLSTSPVIVINMYSLGGVTAEDAKTNGIGNLTMEMLTRGTKTRSAQEIAEAFDAIGGDIDAGCGNNSWTWSATCLKADFDKAIDVYADVVTNPAFPDTELAKVKQRVIAAIGEQDADWTSQAFRYFKKQYYGPLNSPYQFTAVGSTENVNPLKPDDLKTWYAEHVLKGRRVLAIYGDIEPETAKAAAVKLLGSLPHPSPGVLPTQKTTFAGAPAEKPSVDVERVEVQKTQQPLAGIVIGFKADSVVGDPANASIDLADTMCSGFGYPTGYLHEVLRGRGLVYVVHAQDSPGRNDKLPGNFMVYAGCEPKNVNEVVDLILLNIARLQGTPKDMNEDWYARSRDLAIVTEALDNETPAQQATAAALDELFGLGHDYHEHFADRMNKVTLEDVRKVSAARISKCVVTISTPAPELVKVDKGTRKYDSFPEVDLTPRGVQHDQK